MVKRNQIIEVNIDKVTFPNKGKASYEDYKVNFKGGIQGQKVAVRVGPRKHGKMKAKIVEVLERSPIEKDMGCAHRDVCGGCSYQTLEYQDELQYKQNQIEELFNNEGLDINVLEIKPSPIVKGYRNKMEYTFGDEYKGSPLVLGLHRKARFHEIVNTWDCNIVDEDFNKIREAVRKYFDERDVDFYHRKSHKGILRHLVIRKSKTKGDLLINLVTTSKNFLDKKEFVDHLLKLDLQGQITGILHTVNDSLSDVVQADSLELIYGIDYIEEELLGLEFQISLFSFFQTNTLGAEKLYTIARDFAGDIDDKIVFDLYSGTGTISQIMAPVAKNVIGIEIVEEAVEKAKKNAELNGLNNAEFIAGDVLQAVDDLEEKPNLIVIDPPRDGIHPKAINKIIDFNPDKYVYISCNPVTLVRDLKVFEERGYRVEKAQLMDMFPRTPHVEAAILMTYCGSEEK